MTKEQKNFEARLRQVEKGLKISSEEAIKRLGDSMTSWMEFADLHFLGKFDYSRLSLYRKAEIMEGRYEVSYISQVEKLVDDINQKIDEEIKGRIYEFLGSGGMLKPDRVNAFADCLKG